MAVPGDDPRHRHQPRVRVHHPGPARRPAARHPPCPRTRPLRPHPPRARRIPARPGPPPPHRAARTSASRSPCSPTSSAATAPSCPPPQTRQRNLANADHLGILHAIWTAETTAPATTATATWSWPRCPPGHRQALSHQARWLFRTLHAAELAGLDPAEVIRTAIASRDLAGARDIAAVLDARIRPRVHPLLPQPQGPWTRGSPACPTPTATPTWPRSPP